MYVERGGGGGERGANSAPPSTGSELSLGVFRVILFVYFQPGLSLVVIVKQYVLSSFQGRDTKLDRLMANEMYVQRVLCLRSYLRLWKNNHVSKALEKLLGWI